jgi:hypothetical protein
MTGLVPVIPIKLAMPCHDFRDCRDKRGNDGEGISIRHCRA